MSVRNTQVVKVKPFGSVGNKLVITVSFKSVRYTQIVKKSLNVLKSIGNTPGVISLAVVNE